MLDKTRCGKRHLSTSLAFMVFTVLGLNVVIEPPAIADGIPGVTLGTEDGRPAGSEASQAPSPQLPQPLVDQGISEPTSDPSSELYTEAMLAGYAATEAGDYAIALGEFQQALEARPGDRYALAAIENMETYLEELRQEAERRRRINNLQQILGVAIGANDWACAAATVDELVTLSPPESLDRARLVAYRGELSALIDARVDISSWSTVCPGSFNDGV